MDSRRLLHGLSDACAQFLQLPLAPSACGCARLWYARRHTKRKKRVLRAAAERGAQEAARRVLITVLQPFCHAVQDGLENATRDRGRVLDSGRQKQQLREQQQQSQHAHGRVPGFNLNFVQ